MGDKLAGREEGLDLIVKMLTRLQEHPFIPDGITELADVVPLPSCKAEDEWKNLLSKETDETSARKLITVRLRQAANERYQVVARQRELAEGRRKSVLNFVEKQVFPIIDAVDDGQRYSEDLVSQACGEYPEWEEPLKRWFHAYRVMRDVLLEMLQEVGVHTMEVKLGTAIDYDRHEPFDVEADPSLGNECIKAVTRSGYEYFPRDEGEVRVLRAAQVVVVKN